MDQDADASEDKEAENPVDASSSPEARKSRKSKKNAGKRAKKVHAGAVVSPVRAQKQSAEEHIQVSASVDVPRPAPVNKTYRLKSMVLARVLAEITALALMFVLPLALLAFGSFLKLSALIQMLLAAVSLVAACVLPVYGFITYQVKLIVDDSGTGSITAHSLFRRIKCDLDSITGFKRRASYTYIRYVVSWEDGELAFPTWLKNCDELVAVVRGFMPAYAGIGGPLKSVGGRIFNQDPVSTVVQIGQVVLSLIFVGVVWMFAGSIAGGVKAATAGGQQDVSLLVSFAALASAVLLYRAYIVLLMPHTIKISSENIEVATFFFKKTMPLSALKRVKEPVPLLPEGFVIDTSKGSFLIGNGMDSADELQEALSEIAGRG